MNKVSWQFVAVQFDHASGGSPDTVYIDAGDDNNAGHRPGPDIPSSVYDRVEIGFGSGIAPGNQKEFKFADLQLLRVPPADTVGTALEYGTPGADIFMAPAGVTSVDVLAWSGGGASGGGGSAGLGGAGYASGFTQATHTVTPLEVLDIYVGDGGKHGPGGTTSGMGGGGGGSSSIKRGATTLQRTGAGAGGGGGDNSSAVPGGYGGAGGAGTGQTGLSSGAAQPGTGGSQVAGGTGGTGGGVGTDGDGSAGIALQGGVGGYEPNAPGTGGGGAGGAADGGEGGAFSISPIGHAGGGGGGGGHFGGGGGGASTANNAGGGGGGGGSNYIDPGATTTHDLQGSGTTPPANSQPLLGLGCRRGSDRERSPGRR